jgi:hypothetical protein
MAQRFIAAVTRRSCGSSAANVSIDELNTNLQNEVEAARRLHEKNG